MNLKEITLKELKYNEENEIIPYGGNYPRRVLESIIRDISKFVFGYHNPLIYFGTYADSWDDKANNQFLLSFKIKGGGKYQYNGVLFDSDTFELKTNKNDGSKEIKKLFDFIKTIRYEDYLRWNYELNGNMISSFSYYYGCDLERMDRGNSSKYTNLSEQDIKNLKKAYKIHGSIFNLPIDEMKDAIDVMMKFWKSCNIRNVGRGFLNDSFVIDFSDVTFPKIKKVKKVEPIFYPRGSRGEYCSIITLVDKFENILHKKTGDFITLKQYGKSKNTEYIVIDDSNEKFLAVKEKGKNDVEFIGDLDTAEDCWDALFDSNKEEFKDWKNNRYHFVK